MALSRKYGFVWLILLVFFLMGQAYALSPQTNPGPFPPDIAQIKKKGVLVIAIYNGNVAPFFSQDAKGNLVGIDIDLANLIAKQLNVKLKIKLADDYDDVVNMVANDQVDMGIGLLSITPQRALRVRFTNPYYSFHPHLLVNRVQTGQMGQMGKTTWNGADEIESLTTPIKLGALAGSADIDLLNEIFPNAEVIGFPSINESMQAVVDGKILAAVGDAPEQVHNWLVTHPGTALKAADVRINDRKVAIGIAIAWQDESFRQWLNVYLEYLRMNNILNELLGKYGEEEVL